MTVPFTGETMTCVMCARTQQSDPKVESGWRSIDYAGQRFYVCPKHFPPDGAPAKKFKQAYERVLAKIFALLRQPRAN